MNRSVLLAAAFAPVVLLTPTPSPSAELDWPDATTTVAPARRKPLTENCGYYNGTVTEVTERSLAIRGSGSQQVGPVFVIAGVRRFAASEWVAPGGVPADRFVTDGPPYRPEAPDIYRLYHVQVGDRVEVKYVRVRGVDICTSLRIERRPGGRVPPCPWEPHYVSRKHHETANALQDFEERGETPPPDFWGRCPERASSDPPVPPPLALAPPLLLREPPNRGMPRGPSPPPAVEAAPPAAMP